MPEILLEPEESVPNRTNIDEANMATAEIKSEASVDDCSINHEPLSNRSSKYIRNLRNNFTSLRSDSIECLKRNSALLRNEDLASPYFKHSTLSLSPFLANSANINLPSLNSPTNQIIRLKEKFSQAEKPTSNGRHSIILASSTKINEDKSPVKPEAEPLQKVEPIQKPSEEAPKPKSPKTVKKYQKSKTSDLSEFIKVEADPSNFALAKFNLNNFKFFRFFSVNSLFLLLGV